VFVVEVQLFQKVELLGSKTVFFPLFITLAINHDILCHQSYGSLKYPLQQQKNAARATRGVFTEGLGVKIKRATSFFAS
jgi:hypothetical protein